VAADTVGADQHKRADRIQNGAFDGVVGHLDAFLGGLVLDFLARLLGFCGGGVFAGQGAGQVVLGHRRPIGARP